EGTTLFPASAAPTLWLVMSGEVRLDDAAGGPSLTARSGDIIGSYGTMSGQPLNLEATVVKSGVALKTDRDDLFDLLAERPELMRQMFEGMFRLERGQVAEPAAAANS